MCNDGALAVDPYRPAFDGVTYVVSRYWFCCDPDEGRDEVDEEGVRSQLANFVTPELKILPAAVTRT